MATDINKRLVVPAYCPVCRNEKFFFREGAPDPWFNIALIVVTGGLWLPIFLLQLFFRETRPWKCEECGWRAPIFSGRRESSHCGTPANKFDDPSKEDDH